MIVVLLPVLTIVTVTLYMRIIHGIYPPHCGFRDYDVREKRYGTPPYYQRTYTYCDHKIRYVDSCFVLICFGWVEKENAHVEQYGTIALNHTVKN